MGRNPAAGQASLTEANRRAISKNLERIYPIDEGAAFADLLGQIAELERKPRLRKR